MARKNYWNGFAIGAAIGVGGSVAALLGIKFAGRRRGARIIRLEKSVQIGRSVEDVFNAWADLQQFAKSSSLIRSIVTANDLSHWVVDVDGRQVEWDSQVEQFIRNQAIGWKSVSGPKQTGRVSFSPLGNDTVVNVTMNYAPPLSVLRLSPIRNRVQRHFEQVLRDFKAFLEGKGQQLSGTTGTHFQTAGANRATGTLGAPSTQHTRFGGQVNPVEYTRPPEAKT